MPPYSLTRSNTYRVEKETLHPHVTVNQYWSTVLHTDGSATFIYFGVVSVGNSVFTTLEIMTISDR